VVFLPLLKKLEIRDYGLYPAGDSNIFELDLTAPLFLVVGANGLGKSTLIKALLRALTGPNDIPTRSTSSLGRANLEPRDVGREERRFFADRVSDGAIHAQLTVEFIISDHVFAVTRSLKDLNLVKFRRNDVDQLENLTRGSYESTYQQAVVDAAELGNFSDWLLLLRYVTFFQDERRPLLWDGFAQSQVLRPLYLGRQESNKWLKDEREILVRDSDRRNLSSVLSRREVVAKVEQSKLSGATRIQARLAEIGSRLGELREMRLVAEDDAQSARATKSDSRLEVAQAEAAAESAERSYQHAKLQSIATAFPPIEATAAYVVSLLTSNGLCLVCDQPATELLVQVDARLAAHKCAVCGNSVPEVADEIVDIGSERFDAALRSMDETIVALQTSVAKSLIDDAESTLADLKLLMIEKELADLEIEESQLVERLPSDEHSLRNQMNRLSSLRLELQESGVQLEELRSAFEHFVAGQTRRIFDGATALRDAFDVYANEFLIEASALSWSPRLDSVGQSGQKIAFPQFSVSLTGNGGASSTERLTADSVSESQRQYIDLAFRMALVQTATDDGRGTIVIDSPEATLDAVFEPRAAEQLVAFANPQLRHLFLVSNVTSGDFLPTLLAGEKAGQPLAMAIDLLEFALPTAATSEKRTEYRRAFKRIHDRASVIRGSD